MMNHSGNITLSIDDTTIKSKSCESTIIKSPDKIHTTEHTDNIQSTTNHSPNITSNKCYKCNKKLKLTALKCKCDYYFCNAHKYSDCHNCKFDYKKFGKEILKKNNPKIISTKIDKI